MVFYDDSDKPVESTEKIEKIAKQEAKPGIPYILFYERTSQPAKSKPQPKLGLTEKKINNLKTKLEMLRDKITEIKEKLQKLL